MKKSIIALAIAGALSAPMTAQANATLYNIPHYTSGNKGEDWKGKEGKQKMKRIK